MNRSSLKKRKFKSWQKRFASLRMMTKKQRIANDLFLKKYASKRLASPPYDAYKYVGFSELDIKPSNIGYSLLFDK